jgi:hypothetical protein
MMSWAVKKGVRGGAWEVVVVDGCGAEPEQARVLGRDSLQYVVDGLDLMS